MQVQKQYTTQILEVSKIDIPKLLSTYKLCQKIKVKCDTCSKQFVTKLYNCQSEIICKGCKTKRTNLKKYGVENYFQSKDFSEKAKATLLEKYGVENISSSEACKKEKSEKWKEKTDKQKEQILQKRFKTKKAKYGNRAYNNRQKAKQTNLKRYGTENAMQNPEIQNKLKQVFEEKYGVSSYRKTKECVEQIKETKLEKYGDANYNNPNKRKRTFREKYGVENASQIADIQQKKSDTFLKKFGTRNRHISHSYSYDHTHFDSSWELALWIYAKDHNESIIREPCCFEYSFDNLPHFYFPDFKYKDQLVEIKGDNLYENMQIKNTIANAKLKCMQENKITVWLYKDIQFALDYIDQKYGKGYLQQFRK